ncbi:hypothetical protein AYL99_01558 [Fonsecaea erecta]|uniref:F-box domain-containing protein n=1 Tax=Fonsecaea erecta TaxID=1367422 RepID=A0A179A239_9EURO|nr:hypothetical protein AYL99_01558 [Fonsecaea erecta]OAP65586.1 hypothetical protein AYL99_01558 [Fonsecaea erecta]
MDSTTTSSGGQHAYRPLVKRPHTAHEPASPGVPSLSCYVPDEIIFEILSHLIPKQGLTVSTDSGSNVCPFTINSLLQTSRTIRNKVISYTKRFPLHINITSGENCRCNILTIPEDILKAPLGKAALFSIGIWSEIIVTFTPILVDELKDSCMRTQIALIEAGVPFSAFSAGSRSRAAIRCVRRQSGALSQTMERLENRRRGDKIRWRFVFDGSRGIDAQDEQRESPLWSLGAIGACLTRWRWHQGTYTVPAVKLPKRFYVTTERSSLIVRNYSTDGWNKAQEAHEIVTKQHLEEEFQNWWTLGLCASESDLEHIYPAHYWYNERVPEEPIVIENMEIREVLGPIVRNSPT